MMGYLIDVRTSHPMTLEQVLQLKRDEKAAKDAFYAEAVKAKPNTPLTEKQHDLYLAAVAATEKRQAAMNAYAHSVYIKNNGWEL